MEFDVFKTTRRQTVRIAAFFFVFSLYAHVNASDVADLKSCGFNYDAKYFNPLAPSFKWELKTHGKWGKRKCAFKVVIRDRDKTEDRIIGDCDINVEDMDEFTNLYIFIVNLENEKGPQIRLDIPNVFTKIFILPERCGGNTSVLFSAQKHLNINDSTPILSLADYNGVLVKNDNGPTVFEGEEIAYEPNTVKTVFSMVSEKHPKAMCNANIEIAITGFMPKCKP